MVPQTPVNPTVQESETSELDPTIDTPETNLEEATPKTETASSETDGYMQREVNGKLVGYTIEKTFEGCPIIDALNDENYEYKENFFPDTKTSKYPKILDIFGNLKITNGNTNGLFEPQREITRVEFTKMVLVSHCYEYQDEDTDEILYKDVGENTWEARVVSKAQEL